MSEILVMTNTLIATLAQRISAEHAVETAAQSALEHAIEAGRLLCEAKENVNHGEWLPWVEANCAFSARTAQLYMRLHRHRDELRANRQRVAEILNDWCGELMHTARESTDIAELQRVRSDIVVVVELATLAQQWAERHAGVALRKIAAIRAEAESKATPSTGVDLVPPDGTVLVFQSRSRPDRSWWLAPAANHPGHTFVARFDGQGIVEGTQRPVRNDALAVVARQLGLDPRDAERSEFASAPWPENICFSGEVPE